MGEGASELVNLPAKVRVFVSLGLWSFELQAPVCPRFPRLGNIREEPAVVGKEV